jgi:membrane protease YdiL (CAAX protease family)
MVLLLLAALALLGNTHLRWAPAGMIPFVFGTATIIVGAAHEELLFRGYSMQTLAEGMGASGAAALMSALFGLLHLGNPHASAIGIMNTIVAGLMLSAAFFKVRSLWLPFGIHAAWNVGLGIVLGFSLSGLDLDSLWKATADGSPILTGGFYGPEGGILCTMVFLAGLGVLWRVRAQNKYLKR